MPFIKLQTFGGRVPKVSDKLLPDNLATVATNCKLYSGELRPWRLPKDIATLTGTPVTAYKLTYSGSSYWLDFDTDVDVQRAPLVNDTYERYYWTGETGKAPQINSGARIAGSNSSFDLGVVLPDTDISIAAVTGGSGPAENRYYVYTYVTGFGEEGPPSDPVLQTGNEDGTWPLTLPNNIPAAGSNQNITHANIYRTVSGYSTTSFFYVEQVALVAGGPNTHSDAASNATIALNNLLESTTWFEPPATLEGIITHPNGFLVGFDGRDIYMSYPYRPHAWPPEYVLSVDYPIVGLGQYGNTIVVLTESTPYAMSGVRPEGMTLAKSKNIEPCVSKRSIVSFDSGVLYQSNDGIISTNGISVQNITLRIMEPTDWRKNYSASTYAATKYEGRYLALDGSTDGFVLEFKEPNIALTDIAFSKTTSNVFQDVLTGDTYLLQSTKVVQWDPSDTLTDEFSWRSKIFHAPRAVNLGAAQIDFETPPDLVGTDDTLLNAVIAANSALISATTTNYSLNAIGSHALGSVGATHVYAPNKTPLGGDGLIDTDYLITAVPKLNFTVYADGTLVYQQAIDSTRVINLPSGFKAFDWQFELSGNVHVFAVDVAETPKELVSG